MSTAARGVTTRPVVVFAPDASSAEQIDEIAVEEPLEIRVAGEPLAVTMRSPGEDDALALGFLFGEGVIASAADVGTVAHCGRPGDEGYGNAIDVTPGPGVALDPDRISGTRRGTLVTAACGVCGRRSIDDLLARVGVVPGGDSIAQEVVVASTDRLRALQPAFARTGGIHAAAILSRDGEVLAVAEDVGRHNAVDKAIGALLRRGLIGRARDTSGSLPALLAVSGRASFEIAQKAAAARIPIVTAVGAATSLAIDLAGRAGVTLAAFVRDGRLNVYTHVERITRDEPPDV